MPYKIPSYEYLLKATSNLPNLFNSTTMRYKPVSLGQLIDQVNNYVVNNNPSKRASVIEVFKKLIIDYSVIEKHGSESKKNAALKCLLGSLIHRYLRIEREYNERTDSRFMKKAFSFFPMKIYDVNPENSSLYRAIKYKVLKLTTENQLDNPTIYSCLKSFLNNMEEDNNHLKHPHFKKDPKFIENLQALTNQYKQKSSHLLSQIDSINFIQSIANKVNTIHKTLSDSIQSFIAQIKKNYSSPSETTLKDASELIDKHFKNEITKDRLKNFLDTPYISKNFREMDCKQLENKLIQCLEIRSRFSILGAYLLIHKRDNKQEELTKTINYGLDIENMDYIDKNTLKNAFNILNAWVLKDDDFKKIDLKTWGNNKGVLTKTLQNHLIGFKSKSSQDEVQNLDEHVKEEHFSQTY